MAQSALGNLGGLLGYVQNRRNARDLKEYRDQTLADRDEQLSYMKNADDRAQAEADRLTDTLANRDFYDSTAPQLGDGLDIDGNGGVTLTPEAMDTAFRINPEGMNKIVSQAAAAGVLRDPNGDPYSGGITKVTPVKQEDGSTRYAITVKNGNTEGPLTAGGSTEDGAPLTLLTAEQLNGVVNQGFTTAYHNGGNQATSSSIRNLTNAMVTTQRPSMEAAVAQTLGNLATASGQPEGVDAARAAALDINKMSYDDMSQILQDNGMSAEDIATQFPRESVEPQVSTNEGDDRTGLSRDLTKLLDQRDSLRSRADTPAMSTSGRVVVDNEAVSSRANQLADETSQEIADYGSTLAADIQRLEARGPSNPRGRVAHDQKLARMRADFEYLNPTAVTPDSKLDGIDAPDQTITLGNMRELIVDKGWTPTEQQKEQVASQLQAANVTSASQIAQALGRREATIAYAVLAGSDPTLNADQKVKLINQLVNFGQTGDTEYGIADQNRDARGTQQLSLDLQRYQTSLENNYNAYGKEVAGLIGDQIELVGDREISWDSTEFLGPVAELARTYENTMGAAKLQAGRGLREMLALTMRKYTVSEGRGFGQKLQDFFRREAENQVPIDSLFERIRVNEANDTFGFIDTVDGAGIEEGEYPLDILRQVMGPAYSGLITKAANTRPNVEM